MSWLYYLLEANIYLIGFYVFYKAFLTESTFYSLNRIYLLSATCIAFVLPFIQLSFLRTIFSNDIGDSEQFLIQAYSQLPKGMWNQLFQDFFWYIYLIVVAALAFRFAYGAINIIRLWSRSERYYSGKITFVMPQDPMPAFSFFNIIFLSSSVGEKDTVIRHEMVHVTQKHSLDVLLLELTQIISWFNPIAYLMKKEMTLLHEYIADHYTTSSGIEKHEYAMLLIRNSMGFQEHKQSVLKFQHLTNQLFNQSIIKRRINMLNKKQSPDGAKLKILFVVPVLAAMLCVSTMAISKDYAFVDLSPNKALARTTLNQDTLKKVKITKKGTGLQNVRIQGKSTGSIPPPPPPLEPKAKKKLPQPPPLPPPPPPVEPVKN
jgi:hypothetical protein